MHMIVSAIKKLEDIRIMLLIMNESDYMDSLVVEIQILGQTVSQAAIAWSNKTSHN